MFFDAKIIHFIEVCKYFGQNLDELIELRTQYGCFGRQNEDILQNFSHIFAYMGFFL